MRADALTVGELARRTGLTVRTLHHYDSIGLVKPSRRGESNYRLYSAHDISRLQQVCSLRQLGFTLEEIRACLDLPGFSPLELIRLHIQRLRRQIALQAGLCERLESIAARFDAAEEVSVETILQTIERMTMIESYYTPEQLASLKTRREQVGEEKSARRLRTGPNSSPRCGPSRNRAPSPTIRRSRSWPDVGCP